MDNKKEAFFVDIILDGNRLMGEIRSEYSDDDDLFLFYLIKDNVVIDRTNWSKDNKYFALLDESGMYYLQGYIKRNGENLLKKSKQKMFCDDDYRALYENFKNIDPIKTEINNPLIFKKSHSPNQDFCLISYTDKYIQSVDVESRLSLFAESNDTNIFTELPQVGEWKNVLIADNLDSRDKKQYCFSGVTILDNEYIDGYKEMAKNGEYEKLYGNFGQFSMAEFDEDSIKISNDFFNFQPLFYYTHNDICIFSNRYHYILLVMKELNIKGELNVDKVILNITNNTVVMHQSISRDMDISQCTQLDNRYDIQLKDGKWSTVINEYGEILEEPYGITKKSYDQLMSEGTEEIINQLKVLISDDRFDNVIVDLSGGLDSRVVYSALTNIRGKKKKIKINSKEVGNDLPIALKINDIYRYEYDDVPVKKESISISGADMESRSFYMGTYYSHNVIREYCHSNAIRCVGACGEISYRPMFARTLNSKSQDVDSYLNDMYYWLSFGAVADADVLYNRFIKIFHKTLAQSGGICLNEKLDRMYLEIRHAHHFSAMHPAKSYEKMWFPMQSKAIFRLHHLMYDNLKNIELQIDVINNLNPMLTWLPFESEKDNEDFISLKESLNFENRFYDINLEINEKYEPWKAANEAKKKNAKYISEIHSKEYENYGEIIYNSCLYNLHKLLKAVPEIEDEVGMGIYMFIKNNKNSTSKLRLLYNKITSVLDQLEIFK